MKKVWIYFLFCGIFGMSACHPGALRLSPDHPFDGPRRDGLTAEAIVPPLTLAWTARPGVAPGRTLAAMDEYILFGSMDGQIMALDISNGKTRWTRKDRQKVEVTCAVKDSILIVAKRFGPNSISAVNLGTGETLWKADAGPVEGEPLLVGGRIMVGTDRGEVRCFDFGTGRSIWTRRLQGSVRGNLAAHDSILYAATDKGALSALRLLDGTVLWQTRIEGAISSGPAYGDRKLFIGTQDGRFYGLVAENGRILWERRCEGGVFLEAVSDSESVYVGTSRGMLYALKHADGTKTWRFDAGAAIGTSPVLSGKNIYVGVLDGNLIAVERTFGQKVWSYPIKARIRTTPLAWKGRLIVGSEDQKIYGFVAQN